MFAIYGTSGLMYRGLAEDLRRVEPSLRSARTRALNPEFDRPVPERPDAGAGNSGARGALAGAAAYGRVQNPTPERRPLRNVADVMSRQPITLAHDQTVRQGWWALHQHGIGQAPVLGVTGSVIGLLSRAELMQPQRLPAPDVAPQIWLDMLEQPVSELMLTPVPTVAAETDLRRLAHVLLDTSLQGLPVVDEDGRCEGFVTRSDILKALVHDPPLDLWAG